MPQKRKRPTGLPESVKQRARSTARSSSPAPGASPQVPSTPEPNTEQSRAVLVSDPAATAPTSPQRPAAPAPLSLAQDSGIQAEPQRFVEHDSWFDSAVRLHTNSADSPPPVKRERGRVAFSLTDSGLDVVSDGADVAIHLENHQAIAPESTPHATPLPAWEEGEPSQDIAKSLVWCAGGFLAALFIVWVLALSLPSREVIIISPGSSEARP